MAGVCQFSMAWCGLASGRDVNVIDLHYRRRDRVAVLAHAGEVEFDGFAHQLRDFLDGVADGDAAREVRRPGAVVVLGLLDDDGVAYDDLP